MRRAHLVATVAVVATTSLAAACSDGDGPRGAASDRPRPTSTTTTTTGPTRAGNLDRAEVTLTPVAPATAPTAIATRAGDDTLYVAEQAGRILAVVDGIVADEPVLDLRDGLRAAGEQGLLGLAFSPDGERLYAHYSGPDGETTLDEYAFEPAAGGGGSADPSTRRELLTLAQPQPNHNGGQLVFGPDGALYLGLGDGGGALDSGTGHAPEGNAQSSDTLLGKIVRLDPTTGAPEIFASGLRNPWRFSFDRATDDLWIGDVGQNGWEEIDRVPFSRAQGANFGWPLLEGTHALRAERAPGTVLPVHDISHDTGACAIVGGYVYRGARVPDLEGAYLWTDNCDGTIRALTLDASGAVDSVRDLGVSAFRPTSFGQGNDGELYVASGSDGIYRIDPA